MRKKGKVVRKKAKKKVARPKKLRARKQTRAKIVYEHPTFSEGDVVRDLNEDFADAWEKLREFAAALGDQRIYASEKAIMFARKTCYLFMRPNKSYLEVCFFLGDELDSDLVKPMRRSKSKVAHTFRLVHSDQVEEPLTDWVRAAYEAAPP